MATRTRGATTSEPSPGSTDAATRPGGTAGDAPAGSGPLVEIRDLTISFRRGGGTVEAVRGISLEIGKGEILGVVGESGSGKTVLGLSLLGLLPTDGSATVGGAVRVAGTDMLTVSEAERRALRRRHLGAVFQDPMTSLDPTMRIGKQVIETAGSESEAIRLLDAVGVPEPKRRLSAFPHELSGGLRQRVMIARAVAGRPSLVVADEPTTALDVTVQAQILEMLAALRDEVGCSFLVITHDLGVASQVADRIAVVYGGRLLELGDTPTVLERPAHPYTVGLLRSRLTLTAPRSGPLPTLAGEPPDPRNHPPGCPFGPRCSLHVDQCDAALPEPVPAPGGSVAACIRLDDEAEELAKPVITTWDVDAPARARKHPALVLTGVEKSFTLSRGWFGHGRQELHALRGVDLEVADAEAVALVGESGCGKSTLLRIAAGLTTADAGTVEVGRGGRPQMVFQDAGSSLAPWLSVGEHVEDRLRGESMTRTARRERVADTLRLVGLPAEVAAAKGSQLSGGQRQRVAIARALVVPPRVLLCDEPTSALDVSLVAVVLNLLGRLRRELGMAMLFVTHDLAAARVVADRVAVMRQGAVVEVGSAEQITAFPRHEYTRALLASVPGATKELA